MAWLVGWCVRRGGVVAVLAAILFVLGLRDAGRTPLEVFPEFVPAQVSIQTEAPGLTPDQVEILVTRPIEAAINGAPALAAMRSESIPGLSAISLDFRAGVDPQRAHQDVAERLSRVAASLPTGVAAPKLSPLTSSTMDVLKIGLVTDALDAFELRDLADWTLKPLLLAVPGVARVNVFGGEVREIHIGPDLDKLAAYGLTTNDVASAARAALALRGAGFVDLAAQRVLIESPVPAPEPGDLASAVVAVRGGVPIKIGDVATVAFAPALKAGDALVQGSDGVLLTISSQYGANTMDVTRALEAALADILPRLETDGIRVYPALHRPANFIERALTNLRDGVIVAGVLILVVLLLFLRDVRSALISFVTIPLSLLAAVVALRYFGMTLNMMTLGGLAVATGVLVDDAIIDIENIVRRLRQNAASSDPASRLDVVRAASLEIRSPVLFATLAVIVAFLPVYFISGVQGAFVAPLALAFMAAVAASLVTALTVTPALAALLLSAREAHKEPAWIVALKRVEALAATWVGKHLGLVSIALVLAFVASLAWLPSLGGEFMPEFEEGHFVVQASSAVPGTSFDEMKALGRRISAELLDVPEVATVEQQIGRAELGEDTWGPNRSEFHIELAADGATDQAIAREAIRSVVESYPGLRTELVTFLGDRFSESLTGETAAVVVNVYGEDLDALDRVGARIAAALGRVAGVVDLAYERQTATPEIVVRPVPAALAEYGATRSDVLDVLQAGVAGLPVGQTFTGARTVNVVEILPAALRNRLEVIGRLPVTTAAGPVPLAELAHIQPGVGRAQIRHLDGQRRVVVTFNVEGRALQSVVADARARIASLTLPDGVVVRFTGEAEAERQARIEITVLSALAVVGVVLVLYMAFRRRSYPWLVVVNLPFSVIGSIVAVGITGIGLSIGTLIGLVTVFGVSARNAILLLAHYEHLVDREKLPWNRDTALRGAAERLVPILMTALVTGLGLAPLALGLGRAGYEIEAPMAITVLGGLLTSTVLNLLVLPALAERAGRAGAR
jgi:CzcA family heavy metal efflux pump